MEADILLCLYFFFFFNLTSRFAYKLYCSVAESWARELAYLRKVEVMIPWRYKGITSDNSKRKALLSLSSFPFDRRRN